MSVLAAGFGELALDRVLDVIWVGVFGCGEIARRAGEVAQLEAGHPPQMEGPLAEDADIHGDRSVGVALRAERADGPDA